MSLWPSCRGHTQLMQASSGACGDRAISKTFSSSTSASAPKWHADGHQVVPNSKTGLIHKFCSSVEFTNSFSSLWSAAAQLNSKFSSCSCQMRHPMQYRQPCRKKHKFAQQSMHIVANMQRSSLAKTVHAENIPPLPGLGSGWFTHTTNKHNK